MKKSAKPARQPATKRTYQSSVRQQQADETRQRIVDAARKCFLAHGYDETTIEAIATEAGVAVPTVYAAFRSKKGLLGEILHRARFGPEYQAIFREAQTTTEPAERLKLTAKIVRQIYSGEQGEIALIRGAAVVAPALAKAGEARESGRLKAQQANVQFLKQANALREDLTEQQAVDVLWALTGRDLYYLLVVERGWTPAAYEGWLAEVLLSSLLKGGPKVL